MHILIQVLILTGIASVFVLNTSGQTSLPSPARLPCIIKISEPPPKPVKISLPPNFPVERTAESVGYIAKIMDTDCDGISNAYDKCSELPSKNNRDTDGDGWGDPCDKIYSDVSVSIIASRKAVRVGHKVTFRITITNYGPTEAAGILDIWAYLSSSFRPDQVTPTCEDFDSGSDDFSCSVQTLPVRGNLSMTVLATAVRPGRRATLVSVENGIGDLYRKNNKARVYVTVTR